MLSDELAISAIIEGSQLLLGTTNQFLKPFEDILESDFKNGMRLNFKLSNRKFIKKIIPILYFANQDDAKEIVQIYKELYNGTYPYKEMEDEEEVRKMIISSNYEWILFKDPNGNIAGCITFALNFNNKKGYIRGFMVKKKYQGRIDVVKAMIGSMIGMCRIYKEKMLIWHVENRTAHAKSQYAMWICGIRPIAFFPNKDIFLHKIESDLMQIIYNEKVLTEYRRKDPPQILQEVINCFLYSNNRYNLGVFQTMDPRLNLDEGKCARLERNLIRKNSKEKHGYEHIRLILKNSDSYFQFLYTPQVKNLEKTVYEVNSLEELQVFLKEFIKISKELKIRYLECFVSSYNPEHQKMFLNAGLTPRGYVPSWRYVERLNLYEDQILFNRYEGSIDEDIQLINEGQQLLDALNLQSEI